MKTEKDTYIAFLRGINVGGHHKVPMADLKTEFEKLGFKNIVTLLNSGNIIFDGPKENTSKLEQKISTHIEKIFGFPIPTILRTSRVIHNLLDQNPFVGIERTKDIRFYVSFLKTNLEADLELPWKSTDNSYVIIEKRDQTIISVLDLAISKSPKAMESIEHHYGKDITTRNWNTIERIGKKLKA
ncbi:DUF1697 domain-containing protein [Sediminicola sp. YIK13]|uniref:DUF1697 domain-containing protein n=1 Tax=Sediminicola sp. YIK13 TaxID=1453352 RepID=UPI000785ABCE|nr:DUF1697 domain-containing protein [Sediminicola sp. YIK13]